MPTSFLVKYKWKEESEGGGRYSNTSSILTVLRFSNLLSTFSVENDVYVDILGHNKLLEVHSR